MIVRMRISLNFGRTNQEQAELFRSPLLSRSRITRNLLVSLSLHGIALLTVPLVLQALLPEDDRWYYAMLADWKPVVVRLQQPSDADSHAAGSRSTDGRAIEVPDLPRHTDARETLLQPRLPADLAPALDAPVPRAIFWTATTPETSQPSTVKPGHEGEKAQAPHLEAKPAFAKPNRESKTDTIALARAALAASASLPVNPSTVAPIRLRDTSAKTKEPNPDVPISFDSSQGDPVSVLSLHQRPVAPTELWTIPLGNQVSSARFLAGSPAGAGRIPFLIWPGARAEMMPDGSIKVTHPLNGAFDVVIQASEDLSETGKVLSSPTVQLVYLRVGAPREWILEYGLPSKAPGDDSANLSPMIVRLETPAPVQAPYPRITVVPPSSAAPLKERVMIYGVLGASGRLEGLRTIGTREQPWAASLMHSLENWEFRPATRDGLPVGVEILLIVPSDTTL